MFLVLFSRKDSQIQKRTNFWNEPTIQQECDKNDGHADNQKIFVFNDEALSIGFQCMYGKI